jgi:hypothetical protein
MRSLDSLPLNQQLRDQRPPGAYERRPPRKRTCLNGKLVHGEGAFTIDCSVRDISAGGAKVVLAGHQPLPVDLHLIVVKYCVAYCAKAVWVNFPARGLQFHRTYPLSETLPDELKFLRQLWLDLSMRHGGDPVTGQWRMEQ